MLDKRVKESIEYSDMELWLEHLGPENISPAINDSKFALKSSIQKIFDDIFEIEISENDAYILAEECMKQVLFHFDSYVDITELQDSDIDIEEQPQDISIEAQETVDKIDNFLEGYIELHKNDDNKVVARSFHKDNINPQTHAIGGKGVALTPNELDFTKAVLKNLTPKEKENIVNVVDTKADIVPMADGSALVTADKTGEEKIIPAEKIEAVK